MSTFNEAPPEGTPKDLADYLQRLKSEFNKTSLLVETQAAQIAELQELTTFSGYRIVGEPGEPQFFNGWVQYEATRLARFTIDGIGWVRLNGLVKSGTVGAAAFQLPEKYWPDPDHVETGKSMIFPCVSNNTIGRITVTIDGWVIPHIGSNLWFSLDTITFKAKI